ncbi:hypothetical protein ACR3FX_001100 [Yersinia enterocolitica]
MDDNTREFICTFEKFYVPMDYGDSDCIRLTGFDRNMVNEESVTIETYTVDIDCQTFLAIKSQDNNIYTRYFLKGFMDGDYYVILKFQLSTQKDAYYYRTFNTLGDIKNNKVYYIEIKKLSFQRKNSLNKVRNHDLYFKFITLENKSKGEDVCESLPNKVFLKAYQVGQGMCSLLHNDTTGYLIDCGIGTPFKKQNYNGINNSLLADIKKLSTVNLILSHLDTDHYRLISWDSIILDKIKKIYIPSGVSGIICNDILIKNLIHHCSTITINMNVGKLSSYRTAPTIRVHDKNSNSLITVISTDSEDILYPADYSYSLIKSDRRTEIQQLKFRKYSFISVPHHGDEESGLGVFNPKNIDSLAFFSAGNHKGYHHPTDCSIHSHSKKGYVNIIDNLLVDIESIEVPL